MMKHIHHLRKQPEHVKRNVSLGVSFGITAIIAVFWLMSFSIMGSPTIATSDPAPTSNITAGTANVFDGAWNTMKTFFTPKKSAPKEDAIIITGAEDR